MVNCYRKTKSPSGIHFSLFTFHFSFVYVYLRPFAPFAKFAFGHLSFRAKRRISFLFRGGIPHGVRNDKLMVNCQWLIVIGKRKVLRVFIFHFSLFTFRSFMCICVDLRPFAKFAFGYLSFRAKRRISFLFRGGIPHGVRNDKLMVNCQWLIVIGKRKVLRVFIFHFSLFTFRSFMCICVDLRPFAKFAFG
ncbi:hypothetical protein TFUB22_01851 [Tannerella forsythia]|nr:hypothetical protein TFUB22_01851 [Tannerella forsythia]